MPDLWMDVDVNLAEVPVNLIPLISNADFKTIDADVNYDVTGLALIWHFTTTAGAYSQTAVTPTDTGGDYDWVEQGNGMFTIEIPATGGATINNDTEGFGWFTGVATGILPWRGPVIGFRKASMNTACLTAATFSTHSAADVKTAMEADSSKLDHLWETTEDDGGVRRFTTNALEQAPTAGSAPSAATIADAVWDEAIADHTTSTTFGAKNQSTASEIASAIWAKVVDGTITFEKLSKIMLAFTAGKVVITSNSFAFYDQSNVLLFTLPITVSGRVPVIA